jgi:translation initiation factor 5B
VSQPNGRLRQPVVVVLGHVDSGKCVSGDTILQLADGSFLEASSAFERFRTGPSIARPDGELYRASEMSILSVSQDGRVVAKPVSHVWKLKSDKLIKVRTRAGYDVAATPEHKFLVVGPSGEIAYAEAEKLRLGDFLLLPSISPVAQSPPEAIKRRVMNLISVDFLVRPGPEVQEKLKALASGRTAKLGMELGDPILPFHMKVGYYRADVYRRLLERAGVPLHLGYDGLEGIKFASRKRRAGHNSPWIKLPKARTDFVDLLYLVGLLYGDGVAGTANLSNVSPDLISEYKRCVRSVFGVTAKKRWARTAYIVTHRGGRSLSKFLVDVFEYPERDKARTLHVPLLVATMPDEMVAAFIRGFFDAEGFVQEGRRIGVGCYSSLLMKQLPMLLSRFGCLAYHGKSHQHEIYISGRSNVASFLNHIGFKDRRKMEAAWERLRHPEANRVFELTPIPGSSLREARAGRTTIWDRRFQLSSYEGYTNLNKDTLTRMLGAIRSYDNKELSRLLARFSMVRVTGLEVADGEFTVYDFTVDDTHNFLANGLIVHNTSILDALRGTAVQAREVGGITQEIGASFFPLETLKEICGPLLDRSGGELQIPGLLMIDTPGHAVFSNLRLRGGSAADIAIVVVDVLKGIENQTLESIDILKQRRVPFLVALNKVDMIRGWKKGSHGMLLDVLKQLPPEWNDELEERLYNVVGGLSRLGFESDAYYRVKDFRQQVTIVPVSARARVGIPELLAVLIGLSQQFLKGKLLTSEDGAHGRGIILEMQEELGIGETANIILTEGRLAVGDSISLLRKEGTFKSKVKALFMPKPLDEMRDPRDKFTSVGSVYAAAGVKLVSPDLAGVVAGTSVASFKTEAEYQSLKEEMEKELTNIVVKTDNMGVTVKASSVGGLEALLRMLEERGIPVRQADIGDISKNDIVDAQVVAEHDPYLGAVLAFDSNLLPDARALAGSTPIFVSAIIYEVIDNYVNWATAKKDADERVALSALTPACKLKVIPNAFFRNRDPAVFGVEVLAGRLKPKARLMNSDGHELGVVEQIQDQGKVLLEVRLGDKVAISVDGPTLGRQVKANDVLYTLPRSHEARLLRTKLVGSLSADEKEALDDIMRIKSSADPLFGF